MRSKTSCFNRTIFRKNLTYFWPIWLIYLIYIVCTVPANLFIRTYVSESGYTLAQLKEYRTSAYVGVLQTSISGYGCFAIALVTVMAVFYFLYNSRGTNAYHSFPVRRKELFLTNYISGLLFYTVPLLIAFCLSVIVCAFRGITMLEYLLAWFLMSEGMTFFFYNLTIFVGMFTGQLFAVPVLALIASNLYVGCRYIITSVFGIIGYGLSDIYANRSVSILSPLPFMVEKIGFETNWSEDTASYSIIGCKFVAMYILAAVVLGVLAYFLYKGRRLEKTGDMCCVCAVKPLFRWGVAAFASMLIAVIISSVIPLQLSTTEQFVVVLICTLVLGVLIFFAAEMVLQRKARVFTKKRFLECGVYSVLMLCFLIGLESNLFGMENRIPDESKIVSARISMYYPICKDDEAGIDEILAIHQQIIDSKEEFEKVKDKEGYNGNMQYVQILYTLKDGTPFYRNYYIPATKAYFADSESVAAKLRKMSCDPDNYIAGNLCLNMDEVQVVGMTLEVYGEDVSSYRQVTIDTEDYQMVLDAVKQDAKEGHFFLDNMSVEEESNYDYLNMLNLDLYSKSGVKSAWYEPYYDMGTIESNSSAIMFNKTCTNLISVLYKIGAVNDTTQRLVTSSEQQAELED